MVLSWFKKGGKKDAEVTPLEHPSGLKKGDVIEFGITPLSALTRMSAVVTAVDTVDYGEGPEEALTIDAAGQAIGLYIENDEGTEVIVASIKLKREQVLSIFDGDAFGAVFEEGSGTTLSVKQIPQELAEWIDPGAYTEIADSLPSTFQSGDHRRNENTGRTLTFDYYELEGANSDFAIEIEVYDGGETEVYASRSMPLHVIDALWPSAGS